MYLALKLHNPLPFMRPYISQAFPSREKISRRFQPGEYAMARTKMFPTRASVSPKKKSRSFILHTFRAFVESNTGVRNSPVTLNKGCEIIYKGRAERELRGLF